MKKPPPTLPKGERAKLLGVKNEECLFVEKTILCRVVNGGGQFQSVLHKGLTKH